MVPERIKDMFTQPVTIHLLSISPQKIIQFSQAQGYDRQNEVS